MQGSRPTPDGVPEQWQWSPQPEAGAFLEDQVTQILERSPFGSRIAERLLHEADTRIGDMIDMLVLPAQEIERAQSCGWHRDAAAGGPPLYVNPSGQFPRLQDGDDFVLYMKVERVADFLQAHSIDLPVDGEPWSGFRCARIDASFGIIERHAGFRNAARPDAVTRAPDILDQFARRDRSSFVPLERIIREAVASVGSTYAAHLFLRAERNFWQGRNRAARVQKQRQDRLGIGWANHDHHTYRSSRTNFARMIAVFEMLGFHCRERFYAGLAAGWGAQVMENNDAGLVLFCDVDLSPEEWHGDFAHNGLAPRAELNTIGLWCALHGDSLLEAGMHHLECTFSFDALRGQLEAEGIASMKPFSDFPYLRQAFTEGERWPVAAHRIQALFDAGRITKEQAEKFQREGAVGSHLENLERNDGFKGFNQTGVSEIIAATDPRKAVLVR